MADETDAVEAEEEEVEQEEVIPKWLADEEAQEAVSAAEWDALSDEAVYNEESEPIAEMIGDDYDAMDEFDDDEYDIADEDDGYLEPTPAQNAPDWLNAMVPGLDVDYEAGEDEFADEDVEDLEDEEASQREYAWVGEMVEEELAASERSSYSFSRPPAWLGASGSQSPRDSLDDEFPDWPSDDADADVPEWLR